MTKEESVYTAIGQKIKGAEQSQMFGKPCFKVKGKAFISFFQGEMVFKLEGENHKRALGLSGSRLFDPSGRNRPMKEWVQVPAVHSEAWMEFAEAAFHYLSAEIK